MNKTFKSSNLKEKILDIAFKHFTQYGFARTTLTSIAVALGKRKTALYYYFKNKEDLFAAIVRVEAENLIDELELVFKKETNELECLKKYITARIRHMHLVTVRYTVLKDELLMLLPEIEKARANCHQKEVEMVHDLLNKGIRNGVFKHIQSEQVAKVLVNTLKGLEIPMYVNNELSYDPKDIEGFISLFIYGIAKDELEIKSINYETSTYSTGS